MDVAGAKNRRQMQRWASRGGRNGRQRSRRQGQPPQRRRQGTAVVAEKAGDGRVEQEAGPGHVEEEVGDVRRRRRK
jgi:hypothetical protein